MENNKKKLIVCGSCLQSGGAERVLSVLLTPFADAFDEVEYIMWLDWRFPEQFYKVDERVKIVGIGKETGSTNILKHILWFRKHIKKYKPDAILSFFEMINLCVISALIGIKSKIVVSERNDPYFFQHGFIMRKLINMSYFLNNVYRIVMQTQHNKDYFKNSRLYKKTCIIYNPINIDSTLIGSWNSCTKDNVILSAARLEPQKKQDDLIRAFAKFHIKHNNYKLVIYGEGSRRHSLEILSQDLGISESVLLPGTTKKLWDEMRSARMFVMTSEYEGMSNSFIEAMAIGLPCISTKVSGATDLIEDKKNGYLVDVGDIDGIEKRMDYIASNEDLANMIGMAASKITKRLELSKIAGEWISALMN